jgi:hypothetical protein
MVYGDTGWRNVSTLLINGWTSNQVNIRRVNSTVFLSVWGLGGSPSASGFYPIPAGFGPGLGLPYGVVGVDGPNNLALAHVSAGNFAVLPSQIVGGASVSGYVNYSTVDTWPTVLPGASGGAIPSDANPDVDLILPTGLSA